MWVTKTALAISIVASSCAASPPVSPEAPITYETKHEKSVCVVTQGSDPFQINDVDLKLGPGYALITKTGNTTLILLDGEIMLGALKKAIESKITYGSCPLCDHHDY